MILITDKRKDNRKDIDMNHETIWKLKLNSISCSVGFFMTPVLRRPVCNVWMQFDLNYVSIYDAMKMKNRSRWKKVGFVWKWKLKEIITLLEITVGH